MKRARDFLKKVIAIIRRPEMRILPGQLAFFFVLSLIPLVALVGTIGSKFGLSIDSIQNILETTLPSGVIGLFAPTTQPQDLNFNLIVFFVAAFILASNGLYSMINTANEIYKVESKGEIRKRIKAIVMTLILIMLFLFLILVPTFADTLLTTLSNSISNQQVVTIVRGVYQLCKYPLALALLYFNLKLLYTLAPDKEISSRSTIPGAAFTTIMWMISTKIYMLYVEYFSHYDLFYGSMSNLLILLWWVYILSYIFTLGLSFNATGVIQETLRLKKSDIEAAEKLEEGERKKKNQS